MMMLKAFSTITLAAFPVIAAMDAVPTWTLDKKGRVFSSAPITCRRGGLDERDSEQLRSNTEKYARIGWTIKLPKSSVFGRFQVHKHEPRFVCLDQTNNEVIYFKPDGNQTKSKTVHFTQENVTSYQMNKLSDFPGLMVNMGYKNGDNVLAQYNTNHDNKKFFFFFSSQSDWRDFHNNLVTAAGINKEDISNANIVGTVKALDKLVGVVNQAENGVAEAIEYLELNNLGGNFLTACLVAAQLVVRKEGKCVIADDVSIQNIETKIDTGFNKRALKQALKEHLGLARVTMH